jgi:hypothetical protein
MATGDPLAKSSGVATNGQIDPGEAARIQKSIRGLEQAPSTRQQLGSFINWKAVADALGDPFNNERVPISKLRLMRRDPMLGFGLHFQKVPLVRAPWYMDSIDPQAAAFMDAALRPVIASLIIQCCNKLDFGFQAIAQRYELRVPSGTYVDANGTEQPIWSAQPGNIQPVVWKQFVPLPPENVLPIFDDSTGEFNGINFTPPQGAAPAGVGAKAKGAGGSEGGVDIDLYHSLWVTNEKESVFGNIFGYPRLGYAYPYWWSYWFRWAIADRAFEKKGDPAIIVRHPEGDITLEDGNTISNSEYALLMADRLRAGAGIAFPSTPYMGVDDRASQVLEWSIEFLKGGVELDPFDKSFNYLDILKLRSIFVPEQALIEGGGGTSSRNVAEEMYQGLVEAQSILMGEVVEVVNRFMIPYLMLVNFPDKVQQGIQVTMKTRGFAAQDIEFLQQVVTLVGQTHPEELGVDVREALRQMNLPLLSEPEYQKRLAEAAAAAAAAGPPTIAPTANGVGVVPTGVVPTPGKRPATGVNTPGPDNHPAGSFTGFSYIAPLEQILMSASSDFMENLPDSPHYQDKAIRALTRQLWNAIRDFYKAEYADFASYVEDLEGELSLSEEDEAELQGIEMAPGEVMREVARRLVDRWPASLDRLQSVTDRTRQLLNAITERAAKVAKDAADLELPDSISDLTNWVDERVGKTVADVIATTRSELTDFAAQFVDTGNVDPKELAKEVRSHFDDFPTWKAARTARTEVRDAFNAGYLLAGDAAGFSAAQAIDAQHGPTDPECEHRDGQFFTISEALRQDEHPNGTLAWRLIRDPVTLSIDEEVPGDNPNVLAFYDSEAGVIHLSRELSGQEIKDYMHTLGETLEAKT